MAEPKAELPEPIPFDPDNPPDPSELPPLPPGMEWAIEVTAEADVIHADGSVN